MSKFDKDVHDIERLAGLLESHGLTKLAYEREDMHVVLEKHNHKHKCAPKGEQAPAQAVSTQDAGAAQAQPTAQSAVQSAAHALPSTPSIEKGAVSVPSVDASAGTVVTAPLVGTAYRSKEPGATPFVSEGDMVSAGSVLCLVEAMKMFNEVTAPVGGTVSAIHFQDGSLVEFNAPLFTIS
ncbi:MAG: hypothetical protein LBM21_00980 [Coriobacteriales bacterium]|jgi:acetyl-CoA carboxylase biotin carboxyl carrier protein|nr:hypothetical protein [Coriobacteriales bacterium]